MPVGAASQFVDQPVRVTPLVTVGEFRCTVDHPRFEDSGRIRQDCFVFPRLAVAIEHEHQTPFVANAAVATFYNAGQAYRRLPISVDGDHCDWFGVTRELANDVLSGVDPQVSDRVNGPFTWTRSLVEPAGYLHERDFMRRLRSGARIDDAEIEEQVVWWLAGFARRANRRVEPKPTRAIMTQRTRNGVHDVERMLSTHSHEAWSLTDLARVSGLSVFHLCRAFRKQTGQTIHQYREALRLRTALDELQQSRRPVTDIALDAGFSSHSHFTAAFHRAFGCTPSAARTSH